MTQAQLVQVQPYTMIAFLMHMHMHMTPLLVPPTSGASPPTSTMTSSSHLVIGILVSSSSQESLDQFEVALAAGQDEGCLATL